MGRKKEYIWIVGEMVKKNRENDWGELEVQNKREKLFFVVIRIRVGFVLEKWSYLKDIKVKRMERENSREIKKRKNYGK